MSPPGPRAPGLLLVVALVLARGLTAHPGAHAPLGADPQPGPELLVRAHDLAQGHRFRQAREQLQLFLARFPRSLPGWTLRASLDLSLGDPRGARQALTRALLLGGGLEVRALAAWAASLQGGLRIGLLRLEQDLREGGEAPDEVEAFARGVAAELCLRLGEPDRAREHLHRARDEAPGYPGTRRDLSLLELDAGDPEAARDALDEGTPPSGDALATHRLLVDAARSRNPADRAAIRARARRLLVDLACPSPGHEPHHRERALLLLRVLDRPQEALEAALQGFEQQRELLDARLLVEAARACGDTGAAADALEWMERHRIEDARIPGYHPRTPSPCDVSRGKAAGG